MMKRKIYNKLLEWKRVSNGRTAVMLDGARRVGKSCIAEEFARNEYEAYLLIDFANVSSMVKRYFNEYLEDLDKAYVLHVKDVGEKDGVDHLPLYMAPLIVSRPDEGGTAE